MLRIRRRLLGWVRGSSCRLPRYVGSDSQWLWDRWGRRWGRHVRQPLYLLRLGHGCCRCSSRMLVRCDLGPFQLAAAIVQACRVWAVACDDSLAVGVASSGFECDGLLLRQSLVVGPSTSPVD